MKKRNGLLALLGLGAFAYYKYKKMDPAKQQEIKDQINDAKDRITNKATELQNKAQEKIEEVKSKVNNKADQVKEDLKDVSYN